MRALCWKCIEVNLREAAGELRDVVERLRDTASGKAARREERARRLGRKVVSFDRVMGEGELFSAMHHAAHHLNYAWNCRRAGEERARRCGQRDFDRWSGFPSGEAFRDLRPVRGWMGRGWRGWRFGGIDAGAALPAAREASRKLSRLQGLAKGMAEGRGGGRGLDEAGFGRRLHEVYGAMIRAWVAGVGGGVAAKDAKGAKNGGEKSEKGKGTSGKRAMAGGGREGGAG
jgi:hypothetical protein